MGLRGIYREIVQPERFAATERFDDPWYPGEALVTYALTEQNRVTALTLTVRYESREARDGVLKTPMEKGVAMSYDRLEQLLASSGVREMGKGASE